MQDLQNQPNSPPRGAVVQLLWTSNNFKLSATQFAWLSSPATAPCEEQNDHGPALGPLELFEDRLCASGIDDSTTATPTPSAYIHGCSTGNFDRYGAGECRPTQPSITRRDNGSALIFEAQNNLAISSTMLRTVCNRLGGCFSLLLLTQSYANVSTLRDRDGTPRFDPPSGLNRPTLSGLTSAARNWGASLYTVRPSHWILTWRAAPLRIRNARQSTGGNTNHQK